MCETMSKFVMTVSLNVLVEVGDTDDQNQAIETAKNMFWNIVDEDHRFLELEISDMQIEDD